MPEVESITWNFSESGHGKGIPDGVGGTTKRSADNLFVHGADIRDASTFVTELSKKSPKILYKLISLSEFAEGKNLDVNNLQTFKGTFQVHQYRWLKKTPDIITFKSLSCYRCRRNEKCKHFDLGSQTLPKLSPNGKNVSREKKMSKRSRKKR